MAIIDLDNNPDFADLDKITAKVREVTLDEDTHLTLATGVKTVSPYSVLGATIPQVHVSPVENMRVAGVPRVDIQFTLSDKDSGVPNE